MSLCRRTIAGALLGGLLLCTTSCTAIKAHIMANQAISGLYDLDSYRGTVTERGLLRDDPGTEVVKKIAYQRMWKVRAEVIAPKDHAGELFVFDGSTLTMWWPRYFFGIRVRGVKVPPRREVERAVFKSCLWAVKNYDYDWEGTSYHAGREVGLWSGVPSEPGPFRYAYRAQMDTDYKIPLKVKVEKEPGRAWYGMALGPIEFGAPVSDETFEFEFPAGAVVHEWSLDDPGVTLAEARRRMEFPVLVPTELPGGHAVRKAVMSRNEDTPMVALLMDKGASWLSLTQMPNLGPILVPELGIPVPIGEEQGVLNFALGFSIVSWSLENTALTLVGNLPYPEMLQIAASVKPPTGAEEK